MQKNIHSVLSRKKHSDKLTIISLRHNPELLGRFINYFSNRWKNVDVYRDCMSSCLSSTSLLPQWYLLLNSSNEVIGGAGLISNDFISRMDLSPWLCALYIEESHRGNHYGALLIKHILEETGKLGFDSLYLSSDLSGFYEKYGFEYIGTGFHPWNENSKIYCATAAVSTVKLREFQPDDAETMYRAFLHENNSKPDEQFMHYHKESRHNEIIFMTANYNEEFAGYVLYRRKSYYPSFAEKGIPEIGDLNVLKKF